MVTKRKKRKQKDQRKKQIKKKNTITMVLDLDEEESNPKEEIDPNGEANLDKDSDHDQEDEQKEWVFDASSVNALRNKLNMDISDEEEALMIALAKMDLKFIQNKEAVLEDHGLEDALAASAAIKKAKKEFEKKLKSLEEDDSEATLWLLRLWKKPAAIPPVMIIPTVFVGQCSRPIRKQLTDRDQEILVLSKSQVEKKFLPLLKESEIPRGEEGVRVSVYGPDGKVHEMKMWAADEKKTVDFTVGWRKFAENYELKENCDFITIWMFRHEVTHKICFAINCTRSFSLKYQLSKRISKAVFYDSD